MCILLCCSQIHYRYLVAQKQTRDLGVGLRKKTKDLIVSEREECGHGKGAGVYDTLMQSDTLQSYGLGIGGTSQIQYRNMVVEK